jgi:EAL domain-containing protein (putative c-di-GMP-specific phosphodiesterase class I)
LSVNVSPLQFKQADFVDVLEQTIAACGARPQCIEIELSENVLIDNLSVVQQKMTDLKQLGVHISIDDFGTGCSSLRFLQQLPIDTIKVDFSFVKNIVHDVSDAAIVETINTMARQMNMQTIAEGVETSEQLALLTQYGCQGYQGFLFSEPLTTDAFMAAMQHTGKPESSLGSQGFDRIQ